ncbi:MAG: alpha/beta fold hydrolase [Candidatus Dormibacteria bacterium]
MKHLTLDVDGPVHVVDHGGRGAVMLLVHGMGGSHVDWLDVAPHLTRDHHVYALDLLGFGRTPLGSRHAKLGDQWRLLDAVVDRLSPGRPVVLVGNSMGGLLCLVEAARRRRKVSALILVDPALPRSGPRGMLRTMEIAFITLSLPGVGPLLVDARSRRLGAEQLVDEALQLCAVHPEDINPATRQAQIAMTEWRQSQDHPHRAFIDAARSLVRWLWNYEDVHRLARMVTAPTLLMTGDSDRVVSPANARAVAESRPDWTLHVFADTGHVPQMERPQEWLRVVEEWLASQSGGSVVAEELERTG